MVLVSDIKLIIRSDTTPGFHIALIQSLLRAYKIMKQLSTISTKYDAFAKSCNRKYLECLRQHTRILFLAPVLLR